ncbi:diacylglycerol kinase family protein [Sphingobacterium faecale]|uniref:Diacylglycerol kinase family protein n=1 Tax=Sphingobacterium faecale TaxID=2803775 RepID=A0ABS1R359_9SPHI|nr:diacylglycerol kinase family protein [Sphingobacterium faecale]MBL1409145.1 diacylglycerol kinase family protein [Sphingobacterium faecale]
MSGFKKRIDSFKWAFNGFKVAFKGEVNLKIHLVAATMAIALGFLFDIDRYDWLAVLIVIGMVLSAEIFNTALEHLADFVSIERCPAIKKIKDLAAAAVLLHAIIAAIVGIIVFFPYIIAYLQA